MPTPSAPVKTPSGQDELRHRTHGLGQRHRTVLLLVDGQRALGDILAMARQAGAHTSHFEDLLHLGLVELPIPVAPAETAETAPGALDIPKLTSVVLDVHLDELAAERENAAALQAESPSAPDVPSAVRPRQPPLESWSPPMQPAWPVLTEAVRPASTAAPAPAKPAESTPPAARKRRRRTPAPAPALAANTEREAPTLSPASKPDGLAMRARSVDLPAERPGASAGAQLLEEVRALLAQSLGSDAALFAPRVLARVRSARTTRDMIGLVWEIERHRGHLRRARPQLLSLERARDLLGMGNTLVAGDSQIGGDGWHDTRPRHP